MKKKGTPKSLTEAITNGIEEVYIDSLPHGVAIQAIRLNVKDYLAQKFTKLAFDLHKGKLTTKELIDEFERMTK